MNKKETIERVTELLNENYKAQYEYFTENEDYIGNYAHLPPESNYCGAVVYTGNSWLDAQEEINFFAPLLKKYGYYDKEDLLDDLYQHCDIVESISFGYGFNLKESICFGSYSVPEEEIQFSSGSEIFELLQQLTEKELEDLNIEYYLEPYSRSCDYLAYMYLDMNIQFSISIEAAIAWLEENKQND